jgi:hypothetical protein
VTDPLFELEGQDSAEVELDPVFARHETFHPRYGWLKKGFDAARKEPDIFIAPDATTKLGVGKNMVRALRYWCNAYKVISERPSPQRPRMRIAEPTDFGVALLGDAGWDPFLEHRGSLWLLHWQLFRPPCIAPTWYAAFNALPAVEFTSDSLVKHARAFCDAQPGWPPPVKNSLLKDVRCLLRMYANATSGRDLPEDSVDSPFGELGLVFQAGDTRHYRFAVGPKDDLPDEIVTFAALDFAASAGASAMISVSRLAHARGGPGSAFKLTEHALAEAIGRVCSRLSDAVIADAGGSLQFVFGEAPHLLASEVLSGWYAANRAADPTERVAA